MAAELAVERQPDSPWNNFLSISYEALSNSGSSSALPLAWLAYFFALTILILVTFDWAVPGKGEDEYVGWQKTLSAPGQKGKYANAVVLSAYATTTPLGMFRTRALVAPANWYANVWTVIHGVLSAVLITLFILAIRRRFKLQS